MAIGTNKLRNRIGASPVKNLADRAVRLASQCLLLSSVTIVAAVGGTVSPQLTAMNPNQQVQVIVQYASSPLGSLLSTVCGLTSLIQLLPTGELCSMTVSAALSLA